MPNLARYAAATAWTSTLTLPLTAILVRSALSTGSPGIMRGIRKLIVTAMNTISNNCNVRLAMKSIGTDRLLFSAGAGGLGLRRAPGWEASRSMAVGHYWVGWILLTITYQASHGGYGAAYGSLSFGQPFQ